MSLLPTYSVATSSAFPHGRGKPFRTDGSIALSATRVRFFLVPFCAPPRSGLNWYHSKALEWDYRICENWRCTRGTAWVGMQSNIEHPRAKDLNMATTTKKVSTVSGGGKSSRERCSLCKECLRGAHSHPEQWKGHLGELQQFLLRYTDIPVS